MKTNVGSCNRTIVLSTIAGVLALLASPVQGAQGPGGERIKQQDMFKSSNLLAAATHDDWPIEVREGETLIIGVSSLFFDPTVELIGPAGEVVAKNDDVRQGEKNALLSVRPAKGGDFKVRVTASNNASGGQYELILRRFVASDLAIGTRTAGIVGKSLARWHRFESDLDQTVVITVRSASFNPIVEVFAPNGEKMRTADSEDPSQDATRVVFRAPLAGIYSTRIFTAPGSDPRASYAVTVAVARIYKTVIGDPNPKQRIDVGGLDLWTFRSEPGELIRVEAQAEAGVLTSRISYVPPVDATGLPQVSSDLVPPLVILPSDPKVNGEIVALVNVGGTYQVAISQPLGEAVSYRFATTRPAKPLPDDPGVNGALGLGGFDYWTVEGARGQVLRLDASSLQFDPEIELFGPHGELLVRQDDGGTGRNSLLTALLIEKGRHIVRIYAHGEGGGGSYKLSRVANPVRSLAMGARAEDSLGVEAGEVWSFEGAAGQTVIVNARSDDFLVKVSLIGSDAIEIANNNGGGNRGLISAKLPETGVYLIWVGSTENGGRYSVQLIDAR